MEQAGPVALLEAKQPGQPPPGLDDSYLQLTVGETDAFARKNALAHGGRIGYISAYGQESNPPPADGHRLHLGDHQEHARAQGRPAVGVQNRLDRLLDAGGGAASAERAEDKS